MRGVVYYAICSSCGSEAQRTVDRGHDATIAVDARNGHQLWSFADGKYANPVVADTKRIYITGQAHLYALKAGKRR
jgi:outer membrane protein assembly factor BamB